MKYALAAFAALALVFVTAAAASKPPTHNVWHHTNDHGHIVCNDSSHDADAGPWTWPSEAYPNEHAAKAACEAWAPPPAHEYALGLTVNGGSSATVANGDKVTYAGVFTDKGAGVPATPVDLSVFYGHGCTGSLAFGQAAFFTTDAGGLYSALSGATTVGEYSAMTNVGDTQSNCVDVTVNHAYALDLRADGGLSATISDGGKVTYSGSFTDNGPGVPAAPVDLSVFYGHSCTGSLAFGQGSFFTTDAGGLYSALSGATAAGEYSAMTNVGGTQSNCVDLTVTAHEAEPTGPSLTLTADGGTADSIPSGGTVVYAGNYADNSVGLPGVSVDLSVFDGYGCTGSLIYGPTAYFTTDAAGHYSASSGTAPADGEYSARTNVADVTSNCVNILVGSGKGGDDVVPPPPKPLGKTVEPPHDSGSFLCYAAGGDLYFAPTVAIAKQLLAAGYWLPSAISGNLTGGTNVGGFHLVCLGPATAQEAPTSYTNHNGSVLAPDGLGDDGVGNYPIVG